MPQSSKDNQGGKNHPAKNTNPGGKADTGSREKSKAATSPTGPQKHGEKKTTP